MRSSGCQTSWPAVVRACCSLGVPPFFRVDFVHPSAVVDQRLTYALQRLGRTMCTTDVEDGRERQGAGAHHRTGRHFDRMEPILIGALRPRAYDRRRGIAAIVD